ncbi:MAG: hypothetical protein JKX85_13155 [Phycisphaeraceae bacterium]|nr:hypothetical protein [Phycisphaeraceae bacterium]
MARAGGSSNGSLVAAVLLGIAFLTSMVFAILFYTRIEVAEQSAANNVATLDRFARSSERSGNDVIREIMQDASKSVVGHLIDDNAKLKLVILGSSEISTAAVTSEMDNLGIKGQSLVQEIRRLRTEEQSAKELQDDLNKKYEIASKRASEAETAKNRVESEYQSSVNKLKGQLTQLGKGCLAYQAKSAKEQKSIVAQLHKVRNNYKDMQAKHSSIENQKNSEIQVLKQRISRLESQHSGRASQEANIDPSTLVDGKIASVLVEQNAVYVDLGQHSHVIPGMTFEVYDPKVGVVKDAKGNYSGKATIEIINVFESTSVARVVQIANGAEIFSGDLIANLIYDPDLKFKFFVYGEFDLDKIGQLSVTDRRRVENMIIKWGGLLMSNASQQGNNPKLTYDVDFLVLGAEPEFPSAPSENEVDPTAIERHAQALKRYEAYHGLVKQGKELSIPILNQNRFLSMVGYYKR